GRTRAARNPGGGAAREGTGVGRAAHVGRVPVLVGGRGAGEIEARHRYPGVGDAGGGGSRWAPGRPRRAPPGSALEPAITAARAKAVGGLSRFGSCCAAVLGMKQIDIAALKRAYAG